MLLANLLVLVCLGAQLLALVSIKSVNGRLFCYGVAMATSFALCFVSILGFWWLIVTALSLLNIVTLIKKNQSQAH